MQVWITLTEDREGDSSVSVHATRERAMTAACEELRECLHPEDLDKALDDLRDGNGAGDPNARVWVSVFSQPVQGT